MSKRISLFWIPICVVLAAILSFDIAYFAVSSKYSDAVDKAVGEEKEEYSYGNLSNIEQLVKENFDGKVDEQKLNESLIRGYIDGLGDKYSVYMSSDEYEKYIETENGNSFGIGIYAKYNPDKEEIEVCGIIPGSPAEKSDLQIGDIITGVNGKKIAEMGYESALELMSNHDGKNVVLSVVRKKKEIEISCVPDEIKTYSVSHHVFRENSNVGIIKISRFNSSTSDLYREALHDLQKNGCDRFVFDVRDNPGGELTSILSVLDLMLPEGPIAHIYFANGQEMHETSDANFLDAKCAVITNGDTASAAELFTAALKDYTQKSSFDATVVGTKTLGKGVLQNIFELTDGSVIKLTTAHYDPPYSQNYDGVGVIPDIECELSDEVKEVSPFGLDDYNDNQLIAAVEAIQ